MGDTETGRHRVNRLARRGGIGPPKKKKFVKVVNKKRGCKYINKIITEEINKRRGGYKL